MSRAGRKRTIAQRKGNHAGGQIRRDTMPSPNEVARSQPHRHGFAEYESVCHDARAATSYGQLNLIGCIPADLYTVGVRFAGIVNRYRELTWREADTKSAEVEHKGQIGTAKQRKPSVMARLGLSGVRTYAEIEDASQCKADYEKAMGTLASVSKGAKATTLWVVVEGGRVPAGGFRGLMDGLRALRDGRESI